SAARALILLGTEQPVGQPHSQVPADDDHDGEQGEEHGKAGVLREVLNHHGDHHVGSLADHKNGREGGEQNHRVLPFGGPFKASRFVATLSSTGMLGRSSWFAKAFALQNSISHFAFTAQLERIVSHVTSPPPDRFPVALNRKRSRDSCSAAFLPGN